MPEPLIPRITKSTAVAAIKARFNSVEALLARFEVAKTQANLWDGERDGLREAVKLLDAGQYGRATLAWSTGAAVIYPNSSGKHQLENTLQINVPVSDKTGQVIVFHQIDETLTPEQFLDAILHHLQKSKAAAVEFLTAHFIGTGDIIDNNTLYEKKGSEKSHIAFLPEV